MGRNTIGKDALQEEREFLCPERWPERRLYESDGGGERKASRSHDKGSHKN